MDTPHEPVDRPVRSPKRRAKFVMGTGALMLAFLGLMVWATTRQNATSFYMTTSELVAAGPSDTGASYRVNGKVVRGSIVAEGLDTTFTLSDGTTEVIVTTDRPVPDTFREHSDVVARGHFDGDRFVADEVLAKCPSKFRPKA